MSRDFRKRVKDPVWWLEQAAHGWIGAGAALFTSGLVYGLSHSGELAFASSVIASAIVGVTRELIQNVGDDDNDVADAVADALFTWLGGLLSAIPWALVAWA